MQSRERANRTGYTFQPRQMQSQEMITWLTIRKFGVYRSDVRIFFYLMDPLGQFVDAFGKNTSAQEVASKVREAMGKWEKAGGSVAAGVR
jgi:hypothetical protein